MGAVRRTRLDPRVAAAAVQFGSFVVILGIPDGLLGVLWPTMRTSLHRPLADLGVLVLAGTVLYVVGGLVGARVERALRLHTTLLVATVVAFAALLGWALAGRWWVILLSLGLLGLVKGVLDAVLNAAAALDGGMRRLGFLHASWAIGGTLGPVIVATLAGAGSWRAAVLVVAAASALLVPLAAVSTARPATVAEDNGHRTVAPAPNRQPAARAPRAALVATTVAFLAYTAAEAGPVSWGATYLISDRGLATSSAAVAVAVFWASLTIGRLALTRRLRWPAPSLLEASCWLFVAGMALFWLLPGGFAVIGLPVAGLGSATIFPLFVGLTPERLGSDVTGRAVGYSIAAAAVGGPLAVALFGVLASHNGTRVLGPCLFGAAALMYVAHRVLGAVIRPR